MPAVNAILQRGRAPRLSICRARSPPVRLSIRTRGLVFGHAREMHSWKLSNAGFCGGILRAAIGNRFRVTLRKAWWYEQEIYSAPGRVPRIRAVGAHVARKIVFWPVWRNLSAGCSSLVEGKRSKEPVNVDAHSFMLGSHAWSSGKSVHSGWMLWTTVLG